jgi:PAS domain S-box-containing protein
LFLYKSITDYYYAIGAHYLREQAESTAGFVGSLDSLPSSAELLFAPTNDGHWIFIVNREGDYLSHYDPTKIGANMATDYGENFRKTILSATPGGGRLDELNLVYGYAPVAGQDVVVVAVGNLSDISNPLKNIQQMTLLQFLVVLIMTTAIAGWMIWHIVGKPLGRLAATAQQIGEGNFEVEVNPDEMKDELKQLAFALNSMRNQLSGLIEGLKARIQELAAAQEKIRQRDHQTRAIIDAVNEAILEIDLYTGDILDVNLKMTEMYGYSREEALRLRINQLNFGELPYTHKFFKKYMKEAAHLGAQVFEWKAKHKDGHSFWVEVNMRQAVILGNDRLLVAVREISERKRAEQVRTAIYRISHSVQAAQNLKELFYLIHGIINDLMPAQNFYIALYDHERDEFYYPYYVDQYDTTPAPHAPNRGLTSYVLRSGVTLLASPEVFSRLVKNGEVEMIGSDSVDWLGSPLNIAQKVIGVIAVQTYSLNDRLTEEDKDVLSFVSTQIAMAIERKRSEDALLESETLWRTLTENAPQIILLMDRTGLVLFGNRLFPGMDSKDLALRSFPNFLQDENRRVLENALTEVFNSARSANFELTMQDDAGRLIWYACNIAPVVSEGRVEMAILNATDSTSQKEAEKSIQTMNEELEKRVMERTSQLASAVRELEAFSYSVSHDLRAPLRALDGYSRILEKEYDQVLDENGREYIHHIRSSTQKMDRLINDLLSFSRLGRHSLDIQEVNMKELILKAIDDFSSVLSANTYEITIGELPPCEGDPHLLFQLWTNLLSNSLKFTRNNDHPVIEIGYQGNGPVVYFIKDNGAGFDMKYADKLFGVFQRLHRVDEFEGTGVGLAIVERIVRRHGGRIWAESASGEGAAFFFTLNEFSDSDVVSMSGE